jgi:anti-sigma factor (TIGR02949 family)
MKAKSDKVKAIDCKEAVSRFNSFLDSDLSGLDKNELVHHIAACKQCFDRLEFEKLLKQKVGDLSKTESNKALISRIEKTIASI